MHQRVSAVIRTKDSAATLQECFEAIKEQSTAVSQIIVVDSGSTDATLEIASRNDCRIVHYDCQPPNPPFNYSKALNLGIDVANTELVLILSSHCILINRQSIEWMVASLDDDSHSPAVSLNKSINEHREPVAEVRDLEIQRVDSVSFRGFALSNAACLIRRSAWEEYAYNESISTAEDVDWSLHFIRKQGRHILRLENDFVNYKNANYSPNKDVQELLYIAKHHYPQGRTWRRLFFELRSAVRWWLQGESQRAYPHWLYAYHLTLDKMLGINQHGKP